MTNSYFNHSTPVVRHTRGRATNINDIFSAVASGFDLLPAPTVLRYGSGQYLVDSGAADAYVVTFATAPASYSAGLTVLMRATNACTGASTINVNGLGVKAIKRYDGSALSANDIRAGMIVHLVYDATSGYFRMVGMHGSDKDAAAASATAAASSATAAAASASSASTSATSASSSATAAASSASAAATSASSASTSATSASSSASTAGTHATNASSSATSAAASQSAAATSATQAGVSATDAAASAAAAAASAASADFPPLSGFKILHNSGQSFTSSDVIRFNQEVWDTDDFYDIVAFDGYIDIPAEFDDYLISFFLNGNVSTGGSQRIRLQFGSDAVTLATIDFNTSSGDNNLLMPLGEYRVSVSQRYRITLSKISGAGSSSLEAGSYLQGRVVSPPPA